MYMEPKGDMPTEADGCPACKYSIISSKTSRGCGIAYFRKVFYSENSKKCEVWEI